MSLVTYDTFCEILPSGSVMAYVLDLIGCYAQGASEQEAVARLRVAVPDYFRWLSMQDAETPTMSGEVDLTVRERVPVTTNGLYEVRAFFTPDSVPLRDDDLDWGLALMSYAHIDFTRQIAQLENTALDWQATPQSRTIRELIDHSSYMEMWLATRLDATPHLPLVSDLAGPALERYAKIHEQAMLRLAESKPEQRAAIVEHNGERWSMRKIIRRSVEFERQQTEAIAILLGQRAAER